MDNKQYYSCERNHYFFGKLMTVRDFETEQNYFNSKRRLGNRMLNGVGIVSGLDVILVDSTTFSLESGMALDYAGREIVVSEPSVKRLSVVKGFEENKENGDMYLCIGYKESFKESTFSVAGSSKDSGVSEEYNRISEGYELFLTSKKPDESHLGLDSLIYEKVPLYDANGIKIDLQISKYVNPSKCLKVSVLFEKNNISSSVRYSFDIEGKFLQTIDGGSKLNISYQETEVSTYKRTKHDYYLVCDAVADAYTAIEILKDTFSIEVGQEKYTIDQDVKQNVNITTKPIREVVIDNYYSKHFDEIIEEKEDQYIYLAKFHIISNQSTYFIEEIEKHPFNQYVLNNDLLAVLNSIASYSGQAGYVTRDISPKNEQEQPEVTITKQTDEGKVVTGIERINLGVSPKTGKSYYSYEFVHGLGYGKVGVVTAVENKANYLTNDDNILLFGDAGIFTSEEFTLSTPQVQVGAIVNPDKGTMKLGVKLLEKTNLQSIDVRWWAFKPEQAEKEELLLDDNVKVVVSPNTTKVEPLGQVRFSATVEGSSNQEVQWTVTEAGAGTIDNNGLYTAPAQEGVYEVKAQSTKFSDKYDSAYVVVSSED